MSKRKDPVTSAAFVEKEESRRSNQYKLELGRARPFVVQSSRCLKHGFCRFFCLKIGVYKLRIGSLICYCPGFYRSIFLFSYGRWANLCTETGFAAPTKPDGKKNLFKKWQFIVISHAITLFWSAKTSLMSGPRKTFCLGLICLKVLKRFTKQIKTKARRISGRAKRSCLSIRLRVKNVLFAGLYLDYYWNKALVFSN